MKAYESILVVAAAVAISLTPAVASNGAADSIYLKNGARALQPGVPPEILDRIRND